MPYRGASTYQLADGTADVQAVPAPPVANQPLIRLMGYSIRESAATPAAAGIILRNGTTATGAILAEVRLAASGSETKWFGPYGIQATLGIFADRTAGSTEGAIFYAYGDDV